MSEKADLDWTMQVVDRVHGFYERLFADLGVSFEEHLLQDGWQMAVTLEAIKPMTATLHWPKAHLLNARARFVGGLLGHTVAHQEAMCDSLLWKYVCDGLNNLADVLSIPEEARFDVEENPFLESMPQFRSAMASVMRQASKQSRAVQIQFFEGYTKALRCGTVTLEAKPARPSLRTAAYQLIAAFGPVLRLRCNSVHDVHRFLEKMMGSQRAGTIKRTEGICNAIGLRFRGAGRPPGHSKNRGS